MTDTVVPTASDRPATTPAGPSRLGKLRRLQRISDRDGFVRVAAIDHPENYLLLFDADPSRVGFEEVVESKLELIAGMAGHCTAVLADPVWSFGQAVLTGALPGQVGLISGLERLHWEQTGFATETEVREHWTVDALARLGADAAKLVVFHREESDDAAQQHELVRRLAAACDEHELPLVVEPLWYALPGEDPADPAVASARYAATVRSAAAFAASGADVLKVEFPGASATRRRRTRRPAAAPSSTLVSTCRGCCSRPRRRSSSSRPSCGSRPERAPAASWPGARSGATVWAGTTRRGGLPGLPPPATAWTA